MKFLPREEKFFEYFLEQARLTQEAAKLFHQGVEANGARLKEVALRLETLESDGDLIVSNTIKRLNQTFLTPFDPEDIHALSTKYDDVLDWLEDAAHRLVAYQVHPIPPQIVQLAKIVVDCTAQLAHAFDALIQDKPSDQFCIAVSRLEDESDKIEREAVADLFANEKDAIRLIKLKEIYDFMELAADACEHVATALQTIRVKNG